LGTECLARAPERVFVLDELTVDVLPVQFHRLMPPSLSVALWWLPPPIL